MRRWLERAWRSYGEDSPGSVTASLAVIGAATLALDLTGLWEPVLPGVQTWWHLGPLALACAGSLVRRARPELTLATAVLAVVLDAALGGSLMAVLVVCDALYATERHGGSRLRRATHVAAAVAVLSTAVAGAGGGLGVRAVVGGAFQVAGLLVVPLAWAAAVRSSEDRAEAAEQRRALEAERATALARAAEAERTAAVRAERTRTAQELHDSVAGDLSAVVIHASATLALPRDPDADAEALVAVRTSGLHALAELRTMIDVLRLPEPAAAVAGARLTRDLPTLTSGLVSVELAGVRAADLALDPTTDEAAYRIVRESLTNVGKHASAHEARLALRSDGDALVLEVSSALAAPGEPGVSSTPAGRTATDARDTGSAGLGLPGMASRAAAVGGSVEAGCEAGRWVVRARLPLREPAGARVGAAVQDAVGVPR